MCRVEGGSAQAGEFLGKCSVISSQEQMPSTDSNPGVIAPSFRSPGRSSSGSQVSLHCCSRTQRASWISSPSHGVINTQEAMGIQKRVLALEQTSVSTAHTTRESGRHCPPAPSFQGYNLRNLSEEGKRSLPTPTPQD